MTADEAACTFEMKSANLKSHAYSNIKGGAVASASLEEVSERSSFTDFLSHTFRWASAQLKRRFICFAKNCFSQHVLFWRVIGLVARRRASAKNTFQKCEKYHYLSFSLVSETSSTSENRVFLAAGVIMYNMHSVWCVLMNNSKPCVFECLHLYVHVWVCIPGRWY